MYLLAARPEFELFFYRPQGGIPSPDAEIKKIEDVIEKTISRKSLKGRKAEYPERPGFGTRGRQVQLLANYFRLSATAARGLSRYNLEILPNDAGRRPTGRKAKQIIKLLLDVHFQENKNRIATDYKSILVSTVDLGIPLDGEERYSVQYRLEGEEDDEPRNPDIYHVRLQKTGDFSVSDLVNHLTSTNANAAFSSKEEIIQALNIVVGHCPKTNPEITSVGANKHIGLRKDLIERGSLEAGVEALRGFFVSVRPATSRLLINVQVKNIACYQEGNLVDLIGAFNSENFRNVNKLAAFLRNLRVKATHITRKNRANQEIPRVKVITDIARKTRENDTRRVKVKRDGAGPEEVQFFLDEASGTPKSGKGKKPTKAGPERSGRWVTVAEFFRQRYNVTTHPDISVVNVGSREDPKYLPAEVCEVLPGQPSKTKLTPKQTQMMIKFAVRKPVENAKSIVTKGANVLGIIPQMNNTLTAFGLSVEPSLIVVPGRVLEGPSVYYSGGKAADINNGSWNMQKVEPSKKRIPLQFSKPVPLPSWAWLHIARKNPSDFDDVLRAFCAKMNEVGINANPPVTGSRVVLEWRNNETQIGNAINELMRSGPTLILFVLDFQDAAIYNYIKTTCDIHKGVRNVCVQTKKFTQNRGSNHQYFANVSLKVNLKLGGVNQSLKSAQLGIIAEGKTMVVGIDVTHPSPGSSSNAPSVAGVVASIDSSLGQWPADIRVQGSRVESVEQLGDMLKSRLRLWAKHNNNHYPENILVYRDGVSEGQYAMVVEEEKKAIKDACKKVYPATDSQKGLPRVSIIIVGKRHHTRFYPTEKDEADRSSNPQNGTIVDRGVTEARNWDFFLQAHTALHGTARPAHYHTVYDEIFHPQTPKEPFKNAADILEDLTHNMCYLFGRAPKAVSICPPAYYADLVCERARCYLSRVFDAAPMDTPASSVSGDSARVQQSDISIHPNVQDTMFYI